MHVFCALKSYQKLTRQGLLCRCLCTSGRQLLCVPVKKRSDGVSAGELKFIVIGITKMDLGYTPKRDSIEWIFRIGKLRSPQQIRGVCHEIQKVGLQSGI